MAAKLSPLRLPTINETERGKSNIAFVTGGTGGTGSEIVRLLAKEGRRVIVGTRTDKKFQELKESLPHPDSSLIESFVVDLTDAEGVDAALEELDLGFGETVDYYPLAAGGFDAAMWDFGRAFGKLTLQLKKNRKLEADQLQRSRDDFKAISEAVFDQARRINSEATLALGRRLMDQGLLNQGSKIIYLASTVSEITRIALEHPDNAGKRLDEVYVGPEHYRAIGITKAEAAINLAYLARGAGAMYYNIVASVILKTPIGDLMDRFVPVLEEASRVGNEKFALPTPTASEIAEIIVRVTKTPLAEDEREVTIYAGYHPGEATREVPSNLILPAPTTL